MPLRTTTSKPIRVALDRRGKVLPVPMIKQEQRQWCWAGAVDMILHYYGQPAVRQCELAIWAFGGSCCKTPSSSACDRPLNDSKITELLRAYGLHVSYKPSHVALGTLQFEINSDRPVQVAFTWNGGGGHVAVVIGWDKDANGGFLRINDPAYGSGGVYYSSLLDAYGGGVWDATWTGIRGMRQWHT